MYHSLVQMRMIFQCLPGALDLGFDLFPHGPGISLVGCLANGQRWLSEGEAVPSWTEAHQEGDFGSRWWCWGRVWNCQRSMDLKL